MKRSDMIELMACNLYLLKPCAFSDESWENLDKDEKEFYYDNARLILSLQEGAGMLPPRITSTDDIRLLGNNWWEPEDDKI